MKMPEEPDWFPLVLPPINLWCMKPAYMITAKEESTLTRHEPCPECGSKDNLGRYTDGHGFCFGCGHYEKAEGEGSSTPSPAAPRNIDLQPFYEAEVQGLKARGITEETCRKYGVRVGSLKGKKVHFYPFYEGNTLVAAKTRDAEKTFQIIGKGSKLPLFGNQIQSSGKMVVVTEGEIDALSVAQAMKTWPCVSVPNGAQGAAKAFKHNLEFLEGFDNVIIFFDMDEAGQKAAKECAELLSVGKAKLAHIEGAKDANELLLSGRATEIVRAVWDAKQFRPDGIISGKDLWDQVMVDDPTVSVPYPYLGLNEKCRGLRKGELVTVTAGSGIGKSALVRELAYHLLNQGETVGMLMLEENPKRTALGLMGIHMNKPLHISREGIDAETLKEAFEATVGSGHLFLYDHWGSSDIDNLISRVRYMARGLGCSWIVLDHLSIVVSGLGDGDERRLIDNTMTLLRTLVEETGVGLILVSHLKRPEGKGHEEGASTSLSQLRGSHAIAQLSDIVIGLERNQQSDTPNVTTIRVLKNRFTGDTGEAGNLYYSRETGRLSEEETLSIF